MADHFMARVGTVAGLIVLAPVALVAILLGFALFIAFGVGVCVWGRVTMGHAANSVLE